MTAAAETTSAAPGDSTRLWSPVLVVMLAISAWGGLQLWTQNASFVALLGPSGLAAIAVWVVYGAAAVVIVHALQSFARRPWWTGAVALAWGALAVFWAASTSNAALSTIFLQTLNFDSDPHAWLSSPVVEESLKALGVVGLALIPAVKRFRALDGLFYGVLVGAGFQVMEDALYTLTMVFNDPDNAVDVIVGTFLLRGLTVGLFTHAIFTGLVGAGIGWVAGSQPGQRVRRTFAAIGVALAMVFAHGVFNYQESLDPLMVAASLVPFAVFLYVVHRLRLSELRSLREDAAAAAGWGLLSPDELTHLDRPARGDKTGKKLHNATARVAWAADHLGPESQQANSALTRLSERG